MTARRRAQLLLAIAALAVALPLSFAIAPARNSAFSIAATTDVIAVEPSCRDQLTWDLPPGWVVADGTPLDGSDPLAKPAAPVTVELAAGARAIVIREASGYWTMRFTLDSAFRDCVPAPVNPLSVTVGGERLAADATGYLYQSSYGEDPNRTAVSSSDASRPQLGSAPPLVLRLAGRMVLGKPISEGGGWGGASQPILHSARVEVRDKAWLTNQSLSVLVEDIGSGGLIDTHACIADDAAKVTPPCVLDRPGASAGFLFYPTNDGAMFAQVHRTASRIGVVPYGGVERRLGVTNWAILVKSPVLQSIVAAVLLISALLQGWVAFEEFRAKITTRQRKSRASDGMDQSSG